MMITRIGVAAFAALLLALLPKLGTGEERVELRESSGLAAELTFFTREPGFVRDSRRVWDVAGIGDADGDGYDDLVLSGDDRSGEERRYWSYVVFGRRDWRSVVEPPHVRHVAFRSSEPTLEHADYFRLDHAVGIGIGDDESRIALAFPALGDLRGRVLVLDDISAYSGSDEITISADEPPTGGTMLFHSGPLRRGVGNTISTLDFDGDGELDLAVTVSLRDEDDPIMEVYVVFSVASLPSMVDLADVGSSVSGVVLRGPSHRRVVSRGIVGSNFGSALENLYDLDGDGRHELLVRESSTSPGRFYIVPGSLADEREVDFHSCLDGDCPPGVKLVLGPDSSSPRLELGRVVSAGDVDGDGVPELLLGVPSVSSAFNRGPARASLVHFDELLDVNQIERAPAPWERTVIEPPSGIFSFGFQLNSGGDFNGDGMADWVFSDRGAGSGRGAAWLLYGSKEPGETLSLRGEFNGITIIGASLGDPIRWARFVGDVNGDGASEIAVWSRSQLHLVFGWPGGRPRMTLQLIDKSTGSMRGGDEVRLLGAGFGPGASVLFGQRVARAVTFVSPGELRATTPPSASPGPVTVAVAQGDEESRLTDGFEYTPRRPRYDLRDLGAFGLVLNGDFEGAVTRSVGWPSAGTSDFGDVNGDGVDDLLLTSFTTNGWQLTVVHGSRELPEALDLYQVGLENVAQVVARDGGASSFGAATVTALGDINGDGVGDLAIGASDRRGYLVFGPLDNALEFTISELIDEGRATSLRFGFGGSTPRLLAFARLGDIDGDERNDFAVGFSADGGALMVVAGGEYLAAPGAEFDLEAGDARLLGGVRGGDGVVGLAQEIVNVGDADGDGLEDLLIDAKSSQVGVPAKAFLVSGRIFRREFEGELTQITALVEEGGAIEFEVATGVLTSLSIAAAGDVNADGLGDMLLGAEGAGELTTQGVTYLVLGRDQWPEAGVRLGLDGEVGDTEDGVVRILGKGPMQQSGRVGAAGDYNADGFADFLIGGPGTQTLDAGGAVDLILGRAEMAEEIDLSREGVFGIRFDGQLVPGGLGFAVGPYGDLNDDGNDDFLMIEIASTDGDRNRAYVIYGPFFDKEFVRGDATFDGQLDVSDAIVVLQFLFTGGEALLCEDAGDTDDGGSLDISDPIRLLSHLFLGGPGPPEPYPTAGADPTADRLQCLGF